MFHFLCLYPFLVLILNVDGFKKHCFDYIVKNFKLKRINAKILTILTCLYLSSCKFHLHRYFQTDDLLEIFRLAINNIVQKYAAKSYALRHRLRHWMSICICSGWVQNSNDKRNIKRKLYTVIEHVCIERLNSKIVIV